MFGFLQTLRCEICGDRWGHTFHPGYIRLGPSEMECRACWDQIHTGQREWRELSAGEHVAYFAQSLGYAIPLAPFILLAALGALLMGENGGDAAKLTLLAGAAAIALVVLLGSLRALAKVGASIRRSRTAAKGLVAP